MDNKKRLEELKAELREIHSKIYKAQYDIKELRYEEENIEEEIDRIEESFIKNEIKNKFVQDFLLKNKNYTYMDSRTNGELYDLELRCDSDTCKCYYELFKAPTGIGSVIIGICPSCGHRIDATQYKQW